MALVVLSIDRDKLPHHTDEDFKEWLGFHLGDYEGVAESNPLREVKVKAEIREISR